MGDSLGLRIDIHQTGLIPLQVKFACAPGELIALVGPSGAGKSTILRAIAGLYKPVHAIIVSDGAVWSNTKVSAFLPPHRRRVGMVFQSYALFPHLTALGNVEAALSHCPADQRHARAFDLLQMMQMEGLEDRKPAALSGGQQQRVALARALAREPEALLLDEPFSAVDRPTRRHLKALIASMRTSFRAPTLLVTHDLDEVLGLADRMIVIDAGEVLQDGPPAEILGAPVSNRVREVLDLADADRSAIAMSSWPKTN